MYNGTIWEITNKFGERIKMPPTSAVQYNKFVKGDGRADQYLSDCTILKNYKMEQKGRALGN
jgi:hypothetical protein